MSEEASSLHSGVTEDGDEDLNEIFNAVLDEALSRDEITAAAQRAQLDFAFLRASAVDASEDIWQTVLSEKDDYASDLLHISPHNRWLALPRRRDRTEPRRPNAKRKENLRTHRRGSSIIPVLTSSIRLGVFWWALWDTLVEYLSELGRGFRGTYDVRLFIGADRMELGGVRLRDVQRLKMEWTERRNSRRDALHRALLEKGILPFLRELLNERLEPSYSIQLTIGRAPGLSELFDPLYEIPTEAAEQLRRLIAQMPGGSIGISGPRGSGKTTLMRSFCSGRYAAPDQALSVMVSAPVEYAPREFVLHLFSVLCRNVLGSSTSDLLNGISTRPRPVRRPRGEQLSLALSLLGMVAGVALLIQPKIHISAEATLRTAGAALAILGTLSAGLLLKRGSDTILRRTRAIETLDVAEASTQALSDRLASLRAAAAQQLREIKFQQSFSTGWSGSFKVPVGLEAGIESSTTLAQLQMSFPDVVSAMRDFVGRIASVGRVVIGIDEVDKIGSDENARQFLNDIKAIFGLEHCFYLISVSEEAMASFERRGLPFRDVFDSSFDEIIHVRYLDLEGARRLLGRRVLGLPVPFVCLCYCLSGGLPRDLIRAARKLTDIPSSEQPPGLAHVTCRLVSQDLAGKTEAVVAAAKRIDLEPEVSQILSWIEMLDLSDLSAERLLAHCRWFDESDGPRIVNDPAHESSRASRQSLFRLTRELVGLYYYCATLLEIFHDGLEPSRLKAAEQSKSGVGSLDRLARCRQSFAINARVAWVAVSKFREAWDLPSMAFPEVLLL